MRYDNLAACSAALKNSPCYMPPREAGAEPAMQDPLCARRLSAAQRSSIENLCTVSFNVERDMAAPMSAPRPP